MTRGLLQRLASRTLGLEATTRLRAAGPGLASMAIHETAEPASAPDQALVMPAPPGRATGAAADEVAPRRDAVVRATVAPSEANAHQAWQHLAESESGTTPSPAQADASPARAALQSMLPLRPLPARPADPVRHGGLAAAPAIDAVAPAEAASQQLPRVRVPQPLLPLQALTPLHMNGADASASRHEGTTGNHLAGDVSRAAA